MRNWNIFMMTSVILIDGRKTDYSILMDDFNAKVETWKDKKSRVEKKKSKLGRKMREANR